MGARRPPNSRSSVCREGSEGLVVPRRRDCPPAPSRPRRRSSGSGSLAWPLGQLGDALVLLALEQRSRYGARTWPQLAAEARPTFSATPAHLVGARHRRHKRLRTRRRKAAHLRMAEAEQGPGWVSQTMAAPPRPAAAVATRHGLDFRPITVGPAQPAGDDEGGCRARREISAQRDEEFGRSGRNSPANQPIPRSAPRSGSFAPGRARHSADPLPAARRLADIAHGKAAEARCRSAPRTAAPGSAGMAVDGPVAGRVWARRRLATATFGRFPRSPAAAESHGIDTGGVRPPTANTVNGDDPILAGQAWARPIAARTAAGPPPSRGTGKRSKINFAIVSCLFFGRPARDFEGNEVRKSRVLDAFRAAAGEIGKTGRDAWKPPTSSPVRPPHGEGVADGGMAVPLCIQGSDGTQKPRLLSVLRDRVPRSGSRWPPPS